MQTVVIIILAILLLRRFATKTAKQRTGPFVPLTGIINAFKWLGDALYNLGSTIIQLYARIVMEFEMACNPKDYKNILSDWKLWLLARADINKFYKRKTAENDRLRLKTRTWVYATGYNKNDWRYASGAVVALLVIPLVTSVFVGFVFLIASTCPK